MKRMKSKKGDELTDVRNLFFSINTKKGDIAISQMFIIFVSVIAVFVIVGMLAKWSLNSSDFMCKISGECSDGGKVDNDIIEVENEKKFINEIVKAGKLCFDRARKNQMTGELCYTIKCTTCTTTCSAVTKGILDYVGNDNEGKPNMECDEFGTGSKAIITYDYNKNHVVIK